MNCLTGEAEGVAGARREMVGLGLLFGAMYFIQGIGEPTEGLIAQPVQSLLKSWEYDAAKIGAFVAALSLPWMVKPIYGLLTDFVPLAGYRRRSYLLLMSLASVGGFLTLYVLPLAQGAIVMLLALLWVPTVGVAFSDVVVDALMVEKGQPRGITGQLQSIQWAAMYAAAIVVGVLGGYLSDHGWQDVGFLICAGVTFVTLVLTWMFVREPRGHAPRVRVSAAMGSLWRAFRTPMVLAVAGFLFLWNFNPFSFSVLYVHMTREMGLSEQFYGNTQAIRSAMSIVASLAYGFYCRRVPLRLLVHLAIVAGILATIAYWGMLGKVSAVSVTLVVGFIYMTGILIQLDLAARVCPPETAGTVFALLMSVINVSNSLAIAVGGYAYEWGLRLWGNRVAFDALVGLGALCTAGCWFLVPMLDRQRSAEAPAACLAGLSRG